MKHLFPLFSLVLLVSLFNIGCSKDENEDEDSNEQVVNYTTSFTNVATTLQDFIIKTQVYESSNYDELTLDETKKVINDFITSGENFIKSVDEYEKYKIGTKNSSPWLKNTMDSPCSMYDAIPDVGNGISPGFVKNVADLIKETKGEVDKLTEMVNNNEIDEETYQAALQELAKMKKIKSANFGMSAILGTGVSGLTGLAVYSAGGAIVASTAPAIIGVAAVGTVVGTGYYIISNWWYGIEKNGQDDKMGYITVASGKIGDPIPTTMLSSGASLTVAISGYAPVFIPSFTLPSQGMKKTIEITPIKLEDATSESKVEVCTLEEEFTSENCEDVLYVTATPSPIDPGPGEGVTVTATIFPIIAGCQISFSIVGTDGYTKSETNETNSNGQASFYIPGGAEGVHDIVTITTSNGHTYTVTYTF
jgi:hypothetical protein